MEILSKDLLTMLRDPKFRESVRELLDKAGTEPKTVTVRVRKDDDSSPESEGESRVVKVRRLST